MNDLIRRGLLLAPTLHCGMRSYYRPEDEALLRKQLASLPPHDYSKPPPPPGHYTGRSAQGVGHPRDHAEGLAQEGASQAVPQGRA